MSAGQPLRAARAAGIHLEVEGDDLLLEAPAPPPTAVLDALSRHKAEIVRILHPAKGGWSAEDWRLYFEERAAIAEFDGGLPRAKADVVTWLDRNPAPSAPGRCAWCGRSENHAPVVPFGTEPGTHLHRECWSEWRKMRQSQARKALTRMGIGDLPDGCIASGCCSHPSNEHRNSERLNDHWKECETVARDPDEGRRRRCIRRYSRYNVLPTCPRIRSQRTRGGGRLDNPHAKEGVEPCQGRES